MTDALCFRVHGELLAIARLRPNDDVPNWARGGFVTISRTASELSIVCADSAVPVGVVCERGRVSFGIDGVVPMTTIGLLAGLCRALADRAVPVFVISTYDTDHVLVPVERFDEARAALVAAGHAVEGLQPTS